MLEIAKIFLQPFHRLQVEVVGRLVEEQVVGLAEESLGEHDAHLLLAGKRAHELIVEVFLDAQAGKEGGGIVLCLVASHVGKFVLQFCNKYAILVSKVLLGIQGIALLHDVPHDGMPLQHGVEYSLVVEFEVVLAQHAQAFAGAHFKCAFRGLQFAADHFQQSGFSGTVGTDDTIDVAIRKFHVHVLIQHAFAKLYGNVGKGYHI